jgi:hypothetical protein
VHPLKAPPRGFARYCRDAGSVLLEFTDARTSRRVAVASVDVASLADRADRPEGDAAEAEVPLLDPPPPNPDGTQDDPANLANRARVGSVRVRRAVEFFQGAFDERDDASRDAEARRAKTRSAFAFAPVAGKENKRQHLPASQRLKPVDAARRDRRRRAEREVKRREAEETHRRRDLSAPSREPNASERVILDAPKTKTTYASFDAWCAAAERLRGEMDEAIALGETLDEEAFDSHSAGESLSFAERIRAEGDALWGSSSARRSAGSLDASESFAAEVSRTARAWARLEEEDDDASRAATEALLEELYFAEEEDVRRRSRMRDAAERAEDRQAREAFEQSRRKVGAPNDADASGDDSDSLSDASDAARLASAEASALTDAQLDAPRECPDLDLRLTAHVGLVRALDPLSSEALPGEEPERLVVSVKGGHPFPAGELARVALDGPGPRGAGEARVEVPRDAVDAIVQDGANKAPSLVLEIWPPEASVVNESVFADETETCGGETCDARARASSSPTLSRTFATLFGRFADADPALMRGVVVVPLGDLADDLRAFATRARENRRWGLVDEREGRRRGATYRLNRVFEVKNPITGEVGGYVGVEARVS